MPKRHATIRVETLPPVKISWWCVACCHLFGFLVEKVLKLLHFRANKRLRKILDELQEKGKSILGKPRYIIDGSQYESWDNGKRVTPDYAEIYIQNGCRIDMLYLNGEHIGTCGLRSISQWDAVCYDLEMKKKNKHPTQASRISAPQEPFDNRIITKKTLSEFLTSNNLNSILAEHCREEIYHYLDASGEFEKIQEAAEHWTDEIYHYLDESSEYETIQDLYSILRKTEKAYRYYSREMRDTTGLAQFVVRLSLVDLNFRNWALGKLLSSVQLQILQKYESECL